MADLFNTLMSREGIPTQQSNGLWSQTPSEARPQVSGNTNPASKPPTLPQGQPVGQSMPTGFPSNPPHVKPAMQRFLTAEKMKAGYANNWQPNPIITRILNGRN